jgi:hypothetical protein
MKRAIILGCLVFSMAWVEDKCEGPPKWKFNRAYGSVSTHEVMDVKEILFDVRVEWDRGLWTYDRGTRNLRFMISEDHMKSMDARGNLFNYPYSSLK